MLRSDELRFWEYRIRGERSRAFRTFLGITIFRQLKNYHRGTQFCVENKRANACMRILLCTNAACNAVWGNSVREGEERAEWIKALHHISQLFSKTFHNAGIIWTNRFLCPGFCCEEKISTLSSLTQSLTVVSTKGIQLRRIKNRQFVEIQSVWFYNLF